MNPAIAKWEGLFLNGNNVLLNLPVAGGTQVAEQQARTFWADWSPNPHLAAAAAAPATILPSPSPAALRSPSPLRPPDATGTATRKRRMTSRSWSQRHRHPRQCQRTRSAPTSALRDGRIVPQVPGHPGVHREARAGVVPEASAASVVYAAAKVADLADYTHGGPRRWTETQ